VNQPVPPPDEPGTNVGSASPRAIPPDASPDRPGAPVTDPPDIEASPTNAAPAHGTESDGEIEEGAGGLPDWKARLRHDFEQWLDTVDEAPGIEDPDLGDETPPDLYSFFEQLAALNMESRRGNRRTTETLSQWGEALTRFEGELGRVRDLATQSLAAGGGADRLSRPHCLALVGVLDRLQRLGAAFAQTPARGWFGRDDAWRKTWENQRQAFHIVTDHLETLLRKEGVARLDTLGKPFDPLRMIAVATESTAAQPPLTVLEEIARGYLWGGELLRVAQVKIAIAPSHP
jgi:molecular chaperone GrpE